MNKVNDKILRKLGQIQLSQVSSEIEKNSEEYQNGRERVRETVKMGQPDWVEPTQTDDINLQLSHFGRSGNLI